MAAVEADPALPVTVDLVGRRVRGGPVDEPFDLDEHTRWRLLEGLDDIALTLRHESEITAYEQRRTPWMPATA